MKYIVKRQHYGDKFYNDGDEREANPSTVAHLVKNGVLEEVKDEVSAEKAMPVRKNKMRASVKNKGE